GAHEVERTLEVDVPQLVDGRALVARAGDAHVARPVHAVPGEEPVDLAMADRPHLPAAELGGDAPAVPVGQQADREHEPLDGRRQLARTSGPRSIDERRDTAGLE